METYQFYIKNDCVAACETDTEANAWLWFSEIKHLSVEKLKTIYTIKNKIK
tara:strand:- start:1211 stop:1363 length:153 start_codon:yes stop_codon:yes gene_type:complete